MKAIKKQLDNLANNHDKCILFYGATNYERLSGAHETSSIDEFSWGVADRGSSVRVPNTTARTGKGYYEDRRPSSDIDPYLSTAAMFDVTIFNGSERLDNMINFVKENAPYLLLTKEKLSHWKQFQKEQI